jgi:hypothetical protein
MNPNLQDLARETKNPEVSLEVILASEPDPLQEKIRLNILEMISGLIFWK